jgi:hypothetical protein
MNLLIMHFLMDGAAVPRNISSALLLLAPTGVVASAVFVQILPPIGRQNDDFIRSVDQG